MKIIEKAVHIADGRESLWDESIAKYLLDVEPLNSESARSQRFGMLANQLIGLEPGFIESYVAGIEKYLKVKQKDRLLKGEADNLFGNIIIEFEPNIPKKRAEAEDQLRRYTAILWSQEPAGFRKPYLCIATDGVRFITYSPKLAVPEVKDVAPDKVQLQVLEKSDWNELKPYEVYFWLDRYFLRKEILHPTSEAIVNDFGVNSHAFQTTTNALLTLWQSIKGKSAFAVIYDSWEKYLRIVYGSEVAGDGLFIRHTYLATLAKLMSWMRISESKSLPNDSQIIELLEGRLFKAQGIENFIEEDFFSWLARGEAVKLGIAVTRRLFSLLQNYHLRELSEDVLKSLYQELVDPETRHDLGEFYTPDWLAHRMVNKLLDINPNGSMLDPACGSGTFMYLAIREKRARLGNSQKTLHHILESVYGADIHPLAVIVAKTNYILALGDLLKKRKGAISIPVYLADTIKLPELVLEPKMMGTKDLVPQLPGYKVELNGREVHLPKMLLDNPKLYDHSIELAKEYARQNKRKSIALKSFSNFLKAQNFPDSANTPLVQALFAVAKTLKYFIDNDSDTIWAFVLKNSYKPLFLKDKFDFIMGNPPWLALGYAEPQYQKFLKKQTMEVYSLLSRRGGQVVILSHLELGTLFLLRTADLYLKKTGTISFVLPRSIFTGDQHDGLRQQTFKNVNLEFEEIWDLDKVNPLFKVPSSVLIAKKKTAKALYPVFGQKLSGELKRRNASLHEAEKCLLSEDTEINLHKRGVHSFWAEGQSIVSEESFYRRHFCQGAFIIPRSLWFVQVKSSPLGFNPDLPPLETDFRAIAGAKESYQDVRFEGNVESRFLHATLLATDVLPFWHLGYRMVVLPIEPTGNHYKLIYANEAHSRGFLNLARWLEKAQTEWQKCRGQKAGKMDIYERLDQFHILSRQNPNLSYMVLYNTSGTYLTSCIMSKDLSDFNVGDQKIKPMGFVADTTTYWFETDERDEGYYLTSVLNAPFVDREVKTMQARGKWGPRHLHKKALELPIPQFDENNQVHKRLAELGVECSAKVEEWFANGEAGKIKSIGKLRSMVREMLKVELAEIDNLVKDILS